MDCKGQLHIYMKYEPFEERYSLAPYCIFFFPQATKLKSQLYSLERLLSNYDCRSFRHRIFVRPNQMRQHHRLENHLHEHQGEDYLPNALEDFLAIQGKRRSQRKSVHVLRISVYLTQTCVPVNLGGFLLIRGGNLGN